MLSMVVNLEVLCDLYSCIKKLLILQAVTKMVQEACTYIETTPSMDVKQKLIDTLRTVTAGKVYSHNWLKLFKDIY